ncbi:MAG: type II toxin-antitoxin system PemK/MazF family toxin [Armatimonadetes bacterium]|nr:type II toxin-antitoxin system PemK/MazF family toxin [Armatimonadota bacterium]
MAGGLTPLRGEVWYANFDPVVGHEQGGTRPALIVSSNVLNAGPADLIIAFPITSIDKGVSWHVRVHPPEGGLRVPSFIKCEDIRSISKQRLGRRLGTVSEDTMARVEFIIETLLDL